MRSPRLRRLAPLLVLTALAVSACSTIADPPAASVNGTRISDRSIQDELETVRENEAYRQALEQSYGASLGGTGRGTFDATFVAQLLSLRVYYELLEQNLAERGIEVTDAQVREARELIEQQIQGLGDDVLEGFPEEYRERLGRQQALVEAAGEAVAAEGQSPEEYFRENRDQFVEACVSHILVATGDDPEAARREAEALKARIDAGEDFAEVARAESEDPGSAEQGGDLDCGPPGRFVAEFDDVAFEAPVGQVTDPVETSFGFHLILVASREIPEFEDVAAQVEQQLRQGGQEALNQFLVELTCDEDADIDINPRYGSWDRSACEGAGFGLARVAPPERPATGPARGGEPVPLSEP
jgi:hypothetical protein